VGQKSQSDLLSLGFFMGCSSATSSTSVKERNWSLLGPVRPYERATCPLLNDNAKSEILYQLEKTFLYIKFYAAGGKKNNSCACVCLHVCTCVFTETFLCTHWILKFTNFAQERHPERPVPQKLLFHMKQ